MNSFFRFFDFLLIHLIQFGTGPNNPLWKYIGFQGPREIFQREADNLPEDQLEFNFEPYIVTPEQAKTNHYDAIVIGSGCGK